MKKVIILYNPLSGSGNGKTEAEKLSGRGTLIDITKITSYEDFFASLNDEDEIIIAGGDGTVSRFANDTYNIDIKNPIYYYPTGTGNDFATDLGMKKGDEPVRIDEYIKNLPVAEINGKSYRFMNGIGYGIDGYACEMGDKLREKGKKINYISIVIKGILYAFKPRKAHVTVDGKEYEFKRVWFAPTMKGRYYGGGINMTPSQGRKGDKVSVAVIHKAFNFVLLPILPTAFKGEHVKYKKFVAIMEGKDITVKFDMPTSLQVDGETILDVEEYSVKA